MNKSVSSSGLIYSIYAMFPAVNYWAVGIRLAVLRTRHCWSRYRQYQFHSGISALGGMDYSVNHYDIGVVHLAVQKGKKLSIGKSQIDSTNSLNCKGRAKARPYTSSFLATPKVSHFRRSHLREALSQRSSHLL